MSNQTNALECVHCLGGHGPVVGMDSSRLIPYFDEVGQKMIEPIWLEPIAVCGYCKEVYDKVPGWEHSFTSIGGAKEAKI